VLQEARGERGGDRGLPACRGAQARGALPDAVALHALGRGQRRPVGGRPGPRREEVAI